MAVTASVASAGEGADGIISAINGASNYGHEDSAGTGKLVSSFSVGFHWCNVGDEPLSVIPYNPDRPVMHQGLYRLKSGRIEQIGMSWVWDSVFYAVNGDHCGQTCEAPPDASGTHTFPGCSEYEPSFIAGTQQFMSAASDLNAFTGILLWPRTIPTGEGALANRLQVLDEDLDPALNTGALYFVQVQQFHPQDAAAGNADNDASYSPVDVIADGCAFGAQYCLGLRPGTTHVGEPVIRAWNDQDPLVVETDIQVPGEGAFFLAAKATDLGTGFWRYEYALQNLNSHRSARSFDICFGASMTVENVGFHDVDYHSGEVYDSTDWTAKVTEGCVHWSTQSYAPNPNANALRFGTLYNFRFDANAPPQSSKAPIGLFRPGSPANVWVETIGPEFSCENPTDTDNDGESDYLDRCPATPAGACNCQGIGWCCAPCWGPCYPDYPRDTCVEFGTPEDYPGVPDECGDPQCKDGCPLLDMDNDADRDLADLAGLQRCFTGPNGSPAAHHCVHRLDVDDDYAIDLGDYKYLFDVGLPDR
jgi:hypothetical protein